MANLSGLEAAHLIRMIQVICEPGGSGDSARPRFHNHHRWFSHSFRSPRIPAGAGIIGTPVNFGAGLFQRAVA